MSIPGTLGCKLSMYKLIRAVGVSTKLLSLTKDAPLNTFNFSSLLLRL
jgi:hypothetical protein